MKYWHRRTHLLIWLLMIPAMIAVFATGGTLIKQQQQSVNSTDYFFQEWEEELNKKKGDLLQE